MISAAVLLAHLLALACGTIPKWVDFWEPRLSAPCQLMLTSTIILHSEWLVVLQWGISSPLLWWLCCNTRWPTTHFERAYRLFAVEAFLSSGAIVTVILKPNLPGRAGLHA